MKTRKEGAQTSIYLALSTEVKGVSGGYFSVRLTDLYEILIKLDPDNHH